MTVRQRQAPEPVPVRPESDASDDFLCGWQCGNPDPVEFVCNTKRPWRVIRGEGRPPEMAYWFWCARCQRWSLLRVLA